MILQEHQLVPYSALEIVGRGRVLVIAPHPDDEVFGCAGAVIRHVLAGDPVKVVIVTDGAFGSSDAKADYALLRQQESIQAATILGYGTPIFWELPDRGIEYGEYLIQRVQNCIAEHVADLVYAPSWWEIHPDHRALALSAAEVVRRSPRPIRLVMYEVGVPLPPNTLLDITDIVDRKQAAMACFPSQMRNQPYDRHVAALNCFRTYTLPQTVKAAEAFFLLTREELQENPLAMIRSADYAGRAGNQRLDASPPLVSVIVRSMNRDLLSDALDSIALQTYPHIEILVVNALGARHPDVSGWRGRFPIRFISADIPLSRSQAANAGLENAHGAYLIFLDDDDIFYPDHIASLVRKLSHVANTRAAYAGVKVEFFENGEITGVSTFNQGFNRHLLWGRNYIPIHAVLFERSLLDEGCRFDESFDVLEDWDFWIQLSMRTDFIHLPKIGACYRNYGHSGLGKNINWDYLVAATGAVIEKWKKTWTGIQLAEVVLHRDMVCESNENLCTSLQNNLEDVQGDLQRSERLASSLRQQVEAMKIQRRPYEDANYQVLQERLQHVQAIAELHVQLAHRSGEDAIRSREYERLREIITELHNSKSWTLTAPLRFMARISRGQHRLALAGLGFRLRPLGRAIYTRIPHSWRAPLLDYTFRMTGPLFSEIGHYRVWRESPQLLKSQEFTMAEPCGPIIGAARLNANGSHGSLAEAMITPVSNLGSTSDHSIPSVSSIKDAELFDCQRGNEDDTWPGAHPDTGSSMLLDIEQVSPLSSKPVGRIAIHAHVFYIDLAPEFAEAFRNMPFCYDLFVSVATEEDGRVCKGIFGDLPLLGRLVVAVVPNRGRDIAPMLCTFGSALAEYDYVAHVHTKKSLYNKGATDGWREYLLENLLGTELQIRRIFTLLNRQDYGIVYPQNYFAIPYQANTWLSNQGTGRRLCQRLGITHTPCGYFDFPAGSMFWGRVEALRPLFEADITIDEFPDESGQTDATLAHSIERMLVLVSNESGYQAAILRDRRVASWSQWRFDHYMARTKEHFEAAATDPDVRVIVFDIFDTLLVRPLLNPEKIKAIVAQKIGGKSGKTYLELRAKAEALARQGASQDVGLESIFHAFADISDLDPILVGKMQRIEEEVELAAVIPRHECVTLYWRALASGKRIVLASDMYLPQESIEIMLAEAGLHSWHALHVSSEVGVRKDTGEMFRHILLNEQVAPNEVLVVGDNEHSDFQIPCDMGFKCFHVLRSVDIARALPRLRCIIDQALQEDDIHTQLALGLLIQKNFQPLFYPSFDPLSLMQPTPKAIGYSILGPLVLSFAQWLARRASLDGIKRLYFLSREGDFLKMVYDRWRLQDAESPHATYLVLSRRSVTVPAIANRQDIFDIARIAYAPGPISNLMHERFGLVLDEDEWDVIERQGLWGHNLNVEITDSGIDHLKPLLGWMEKRIYMRSSFEREGLSEYLREMGLNEDHSCAVVDIGYSGTIQGALNRLLKRPVHGYYLITDQRARNIAERYSVHVKGCFGDFLSHEAGAQPLLTKSFFLEKLLSSDDPQIVCYERDLVGEVVPVMRSLSDEEVKTRKLRAEIRSGALEFVDDAIALRSKLLNDFLMPSELAIALYESFVANPSRAEEEILAELVLDDHYCGRGLVR